MKIIHRLKEAWNKFIFCYTATKGLSSFLSLMWFTKLYRLRKKSLKYQNLQNRYFSISITAFPGKKIFLRTYAGDIDIFYEIFYKKIYQLTIELNKNMIIDAGANVGFAALFFLKQMPGATIYCIEPDPDNFIFLKKNLEAEIENGKIKIMMAGLSGKDGVMSLERNFFKYNSNLVEAPIEGAVQVLTYKVETFLRTFVSGSVDLFKMDIEGAEEGIFENDVSWLKNVDQLLIEFHSDKIKEMCFEKLTSQNFYFIPQKNRQNTNVFLFRKSG